ncbi:cryptochrome/photolyase family protein [Ferrimonas balearica]|uniref:cryptochrome/photolyase family protein n=1 Tax=Ferrimonas balearica TaxID=44012 RepID=UPI001C992B57|nr:FAD-binding domain-containing protein [Ferrimonas balearica]MBY5920821.1 deoxyribodipyrimidine photo-lyase [Ferrimonas balearica]MBY5996494.1 deoxyribodipyrimidine photo-lyase [Ferrimonas balearica]
MQLVWFRDDLRIHDHPALHGARAAGAVVGLYIASPAQWAMHDCVERKRQWHYANVQHLSAQLAERGIPLVVWHCDHFSEIPARLEQFCSDLPIKAVHCHHAIGVNECQLENQLSDRLPVPLIRYLDANLVDYDSVATGQGGVYRVFTPFARRCRQQLDLSEPLPPPEPQVRPPASLDSDSWVESPLPLWPAGEESAQRALARFCNERVSGYHQWRDRPDHKGTSALSPYFAAGVISPRQALFALRAQPDGDGAQSWLNELLWREFYRYLMHHFPNLSRHQALYPHKEAEWHGPADWFSRWQSGQTGFPLVDAGMRQLNATGWMHNRVRMLCASFLVKDLHLDWRLGEAYFMNQLVDGDLASNNGGWQWAAGCGADAAPYFRHFNPYRQSERFDPDGDYIRHWVPELSDVPAKQLHKGGPFLLAPDYPPPMVDHRQQAAAFTEQFKRHTEAMANAS